MPSASDWLDGIRLASPRAMSWDAMEGDARKRFCRDCRLNVYNLSSMTRPEAVDLVKKAEGRLCVAFHRRPDGTILTQDCPVGLRLARKRLAKLAAVMAAGLLMIGGGALFALGREGARDLRFGRIRAIEPFRTVFEWLDPTPVVPVAVPGGILAPPPAGRIRAPSCLPAR